MTHTLTLEEKTLAYWNICRSKHLPWGVPVTTELAIYVLNGILDITAPHRPLRRSVLRLQDGIIIGDDINEDKGAS